MSRRSQSPEGVGDLLKHDSFDAFEEEEHMQDATHDPGANGGGGDDPMVEEASKDGLSASEGGREPRHNGATSGASGGGANGIRPGIKRIPVPRFKGTATAAAGTATPALPGSKGPARYFIVKSNNHSNIEHSIQNGIWATQKHNEDKFVEAYRSASSVFLVYSVNMSGHFQGYAKMSSLPFKHHQGTWEGASSVSNSFNVDWVRRYDLPFRSTEGLTNPLNENKPVKISRDGQELPSPLGLQLCNMFDQEADAAGVPKPAPPTRNPNMRAGPAVGGSGGGGFGVGPPRGPPERGDRNRREGPMPPPGGPPGGGGGLGNGMVPTPMGPMPAHLAMQMGMGGPGMGMGMGGPMGGLMGMPGLGMGMPGMGMGPMGMGPMGMEDMNPMMMGMDPVAMGGMNPMMMGMNPMMMGGGPGMGGPMGPVPPKRGPVPPPKPPPRSPPGGGGRSAEEEFMQMMMKMRGRSEAGLPSGRAQEEVMMRAYENMRRGGRSPRRDRRYRSRSRSGSPRRRRRSRSRTRSRSPRGRGRGDSMDMAYEDYLEAFKVLKQKKKGGDGMVGGGLGSGMNPMMSQMGGQMGMGGMMGEVPPAMGASNSGMGQMGGMMGMGGGMKGPGGAPGGGAGGVNNMSEDEYVRVWENYSKMSGRAFDAGTVRGWYRQFKGRG